ncbi:MAG: methionine biosynthesis protein MetW [Deltaproteobacteria bacterium]|nr:methionine biosynthesis protein MetW [Deltaproteobacteria bacterium]MBW2318335.1 methionine biosynthesis protein MetW [Deltaproteobacteria bacterium]MBW2601661.1 methionine biosynthesis protein MetW [Deltaproteobacteria bacterium]
MRFDLQIVASWIESGSKVLDLGCGAGDLLYFLKEKKQVVGTGIECVEAKVACCIERGLSVLHGDINEEVLDYPDDTFDYVILSQTLQQVYEPEQLIRILLRIGKKGIVSFPNFSHWGVRVQLLITGYAPITKQLPYEWYDTPNIRVITIKDFRKFSRKVGFRIIKEVAINSPKHDKRGDITHFLPTLRATYGLFMIGKDKS